MCCTFHDMDSLCQLMFIRHFTAHRKLCYACLQQLFLACKCREYYTLDHLRRLKQFESQSPYNEAKCSDYCKDYHVQPCRACTTCHFCRYLYGSMCLELPDRTVVTTPLNTCYVSRWKVATSRLQLHTEHIVVNLRRCHSDLLI